VDVHEGRINLRGMWGIQHTHVVCVSDVTLVLVFTRFTKHKTDCRRYTGNIAAACLWCLFNVRLMTVQSKDVGLGILLSDKLV